MANILHLEPEQDIGYIVQYALKEHQVDRFPDPNEAFKALNNGKRYEMLILEPSIGRPAYNLAELARKKGLPVIYLTKLEPGKLGSSQIPNKYVRKPFDPLSLPDIVAEFLTGNGSAGSAEKKT